MTLGLIEAINWPNAPQNNGTVILEMLEGLFLNNKSTFRGQNTFYGQCMPKSIFLEKLQSNGYIYLITLSSCTLKTES